MVTVQPERRESTEFIFDRVSIFSYHVTARTFDWTVEANFWRESKPQYVHVCPDTLSRDPRE